MSDPLRSRRALAAALGIAALVLVVVVTAAPLEENPTRVTQGIVLVLPVVAAALAFGRRASYVAAVGVTVLFTMLVPPVFRPQVHLLEDLVALVVFGAVAATVSALVGGHVELLDRVEQQRRAVLRSVSHDLRTPLTAIRAAASEAATGDAVDRVGLLELIEDEAERLDRIVANLLALGRVEAGAFTPRRDPVDVGEVVGAAVARLRRFTRNTPLDVTIEEPLPLVLGDFTQLDQLVTNLLENAVRHSPPGSPVDIAVRDDGRGGVVVDVADAGPGVPVELRSRVFEPFRSGDRPGTSGIGLAICAAVAHGHGGAIAIGDGPRGGACFTVTLPASRPRSRSD